LMLINEFTKKAYKKNKPVSICGELASDTSSINKLLQMNIDALSIAPALIPETKEFIRSLE
jgi:phosphoenolpyruvate-protein kinase (PTS system EI component)